MKIVSFTELCALPDGTIFSYWEPCIASGLFRRGSVIFDADGKPIDFFEASLTPESYNGDDPVVELVEGRWGLFEHDMQFVLIESEDISVIAEGLGIQKPDETVIDIDQVRREFEKWIRSPPFEKSCLTYPDMPEKYAWPGSYRSYEVQLAWESWKAARGVK